MLQQFINNIPVNNIHEIKHHVAECKKANMKEIKFTFSTISKQALHPQLGIPQLYHDQLAHIYSPTNLQLTT